MARPLRIQYPGAVYHVTSRGNERRDIYRDDKDREAFLSILAQSSNIFGVRLFSYVLMSNHFHLLIQTPLGNLGEFMRQFNISYTSYFNRRYSRSGHLYQGRYTSIIVDKDEYLSVLSRYIHLNPVRIKKAANMEKDEKLKYLLDYKWSSLPGYIDRKRKEKGIDDGLVLEEYGGDNERGRKAYRRAIEQDITTELEIKSRITGQSILGSDEFIDWIKREFLEGKEDRECPSLRQLQQYRAKEEIIRAIETAAGKSFEEIKTGRGIYRQIAVDVLYRRGGLTNRQIGEIFGLDYSTVSVTRKRLQERMMKNKQAEKIVTDIEQELTRIKN